MNTIPRRSKLPKKSSPDRVNTRENVAEFLLRGGTVTQCPSRSATLVSQSPTIYVDGQHLPMGTVQQEYIPSFVRDIATYDAAQAEVLCPDDDGTPSTWRVYEQSSIPSEWRPGVSSERYE